MENQLNNGFCPKCGALLRDGACPSCGFDSSNANAGAAVQDTENVQQVQYDRNYSTQSTDSQNTDNQNQYDQSGYNQNAYDRNQYGQNGYTQGQYTQNGYNQNRYTQNGYNQNQYTQNEYNQNQYNQNQYNQNGNYGNQYYQNPQGGYYQQNGNGYYGQPPKKSGNGSIIAIIVGGIVLLLLVVIGVAIGLVRALDSANEHKEDNDLYNYDDDYNYNYDYDDDYNYDDDDSYDDLMDFVDDIDWDDDEHWKREPHNYDPEDVGTDYYYELCNCIDEAVSYDMVHENYEELERENNVCIRINYYQLEGDIPNLTEINAALEAVAMMPAELYHDEIDEFEYEFERYGAGYVAEVESYITYNDEQTISVTADIYYESATSIRRVLNCVNIDIETGTVLKNTDILDISDDFISDYREICEDQNGLIPALKLFSDDELREFLENEDNLIAYYTPCGLEIGINYETEEKYGWFSATLTDYEQYMKSY